MITARRPRPITLDEYLRIEREAPSKSEWLRGEVYAMTGGTLEHSRIAASVIVALGRRLAGGPCAVFDANLRVHIAEAELVTYPDVTVICGDPEFHDDGPRDTVRNPSLVVEVLSPSTEAYDRGEKLLAYQARASLVYVLLVHQDGPVVELFARGERGAWIPSVVNGLDASVPLPRLGVEVPLAEVY